MLIEHTDRICNSNQREKIEHLKAAYTRKQEKTAITPLNEQCCAAELDTIQRIELEAGRCVLFGKSWVNAYIYLAKRVGKFHRHRKSKNER